MKKWKTKRVGRSWLLNLKCADRLSRICALLGQIKAPFAALAETSRNRAEIRADQRWAELWSRYSQIYQQALYVEGLRDDALKMALMEAILAAGRLGLDRGLGGCVAEILWRSCEAVIPHTTRGGTLRYRFHLRMLVDDMSDVGAREMLRRFMFTETQHVSLARQNGRSLVDELADQETVLTACESFAEHLHRNRRAVERETAGAISSASLASIEGALQVIAESVGD